MVRKMDVVDWLLIVLFIVIVPGIRTDFGGEMVWWEPWFLIYFRRKKARVNGEEP